MEVVTCPHCGTRVVITDQGDCPSCRRPVEEAVRDEALSPSVVAKETGGPNRGTSSPVSWPVGWKRRVFTCAAICSAVGAIVGANQELQQFVGLDATLSLGLLLLGWFTGAIVWLGIEYRRA